MTRQLQYLLDTNICIYIIRNRSQSTVDRFRQFQPGEIGISAITAAELRFGVEKSQQQAQNLQALELFLLPLAIIEFDEGAATVYGRVRTQLEAAGTPIGSLDTLIAAHALHLGVPLVTNNVREFERVAGLAVENWTV